MISKSFVSFLAVAAIVPLSQVVPATAAVLDVFAPRWTFPTAGAKLEREQTYEARWDVSNAPAHVTNTVGTIYWLKDDGDIDLDNPVAHDFSILAGKVPIKISENIKPGKHQFVLFGDSGDDSPVFTVV